MKKFTCAFLSLLLILSLALVPVCAGDATPTTVGYSADLVEEVDLTSVPEITAVTDFSTATEVKITNAAGMQKLAEVVNGGNNFLNKTVYLETDINMSSVTDWTPIGDNSGGVWSNSSDPSFRGTFDGQGHAIKNLKVNSEEEANFVCVGIFGKLYNGTIKNLVIDETCSFAYSGGWTTARTAALVAFMFNSNQVVNTIYNVQNNAAVTANAGHVGGLVATGATWYGAGANAITNCTNTGNITATGTAWAHGATTYDSTDSTSMGATAGGFVGNLVRGTVSIVNCNNTGAISAAGYAGGMIAGETGDETITVQGCVNCGSVTGLVAGGMIGEWHNGGNAVSGCTNTGKITATDADTGSAGQIIGIVTSGGTGNVSGNTEAVDSVKVLGYQKAKDVTTKGDASYRSVRLVGALNPGEEELSEFDLVGLEITVTYTKDGETVTKNLKGSCVTVYKSLSGMDNTQDNPDPLMKEEGEYYFAVVLENIPTALENVKLSITPYFMEGTTTVYGFTAHATVSVAAAN
ncbi:MAG: hypothetical protein IJF33_00600 [Clostridia bacterium]|nr:hypothetical protein [Clostridia bacterium]